MNEISYYKLNKYITKLSNESITSDNFGKYLNKVNYWYDQLGGGHSCKNKARAPTYKSYFDEKTAECENFNADADTCNKRKYCKHDGKKCKYLDCNGRPKKLCEDRQCKVSLDNGKCSHLCDWY